MESCRLRIHSVCPSFPFTYFSKYTPASRRKGVIHPRRCTSCGDCVNFSYHAGKL